MPENQIWRNARVIGRSEIELCNMNEFDEYIVHGEPGQKGKSYTWQTATGLQVVDGLMVTVDLPDIVRNWSMAIE